MILSPQDSAIPESMSFPLHILPLLPNSAISNQPLTELVTAEEGGVDEAEPDFPGVEGFKLFEGSQ